MSDSSSASSLIGTWRLVAWQALGDDGSVEWPMGEDAKGMLVYTDDGRMMTMLGRAGRLRHAGQDLTASQPAEQVAAMQSFVAYGGRWQLDGDSVTHQVEMSLFPNWVGSRQVRRVELQADGRRVTLSSPPVSIGGSTRIQRLTFERLETIPSDQD